MVPFHEVLPLGEGYVVHIVARAHGVVNQIKRLSSLQLVFPGLSSL